MKPVLTCRELVEFLDRYFARELPPDASIRFDAHLAACPPCVAYARSYRETVALTRSAFEDDDAAVSGVPDELVVAILAASNRSA